MSLAKPLFESTINTISGNAEMSLEFLDELRQLKSHYMSERRRRDNTYGAAVSIHSLPVTDHAKKSVRIESCPTGSTGAKKRAAKKQPT